MGKKIRLIRTTIIEYEPDPKNYPYCDNIEEMASLDASAEDLEVLFSTDVKSDNVEYEIID